MKLSKKGEVTDCNNLRGVTLLPIVSKAFTCVILREFNMLSKDSYEKNQQGSKKVDLVRNRYLSWETLWNNALNGSKIYI